MRNREEELFERLKKVKFNPYTLKKTRSLWKRRVYKICFRYNKDR